MKALYVTVSMPYGSGETFLITEANELIRQGCELLIVPRSASGDQVVNADAKRLEAICLSRPLLCAEIALSALTECLRSPIASLKALGRIMGSRNATILLKNLVVYPKGLWLGRLARNNGFEHIHAHWALTTATMAMVASEVSGVPWSFTAHRGDIADNNLLAQKARHASFVRFISESGLGMAKSLGAKCSEQNTYVVHMGVEVSALEPKAPDIGPVARILCPANLLPVKGHKYLLEAIHILIARGIRCSLDVAGNGILRDTLGRQVAELAIEDAVSFRGYVPHDEILRMYENAQVDMVVLPSVDLGDNVHEGIPTALMEAMSYGIPTISTSTGGIPELMGGGAGVLVPPKNAKALADAIESLIKSPEAAAQVAVEGRRRVLEEYAVERVVSRLISLFRKGA